MQESGRTLQEKKDRYESTETLDWRGFQPILCFVSMCEHDDNNPLPLLHPFPHPFPSS